jgi:hypothetical protein
MILYDWCSCEPRPNFKFTPNNLETFKLITRDCLETAGSGSRPGIPVKCASAASAAENAEIMCAKTTNEVTTSVSFYRIENNIYIAYSAGYDIGKTNKFLQCLLLMGGIKIGSPDGDGNVQIKLKIPTTLATPYEILSENQTSDIVSAIIENNSPYLNNILADYLLRHNPTKSKGAGDGGGGEENGGGATAAGDSINLPAIIERGRAINLSARETECDSFHRSSIMESFGKLNNFLIGKVSDKSLKPTMTAFPGTLQSLPPTELIAAIEAYITGFPPEQLGNLFSSEPYNTYKRVVADIRAQRSFVLPNRNKINSTKLSSEKGASNTEYTITIVGETSSTRSYWEIPGTRNPPVSLVPYKISRDATKTEPGVIVCFNGLSCSEPKLFSYLHSKSPGWQGNANRAFLCSWFGKTNNNIYIPFTCEQKKESKFIERYFLNRFYRKYDIRTAIILKHHFYTLLTCMAPCMGCKMNFTQIINNTPAEAWNKTDCGSIVAAAAAGGAGAPARLPGANAPIGPSSAAAAAFFLEPSAEEIAAAAAAKLRLVEAEAAAKKGGRRSRKHQLKKQTRRRRETKRHSRLSRRI